MGIRVYYSEISAHKEVKKRQQKVMMILESKTIPYEAIDITEPGKESDKDFMLTNAKPKGDSKYILSPQVFNGETYCGDYEDFELANENDELEKFLNIEKIDNGMKKVNVNQNQNQNGTAKVNGSSREGSAEKQAEPVAVVPPPPKPVSTEPEPASKEEEVAEPLADVPQEASQPEPEGGEEEEPMSTTEPAPQPPPPAEIVEEGLDDSVPPEFSAEIEDEDEEGE